MRSVIPEDKITVSRDNPLSIIKHSCIGQQIGLIEHLPIYVNFATPNRHILSRQTDDAFNIIIGSIAWKLKDNYVTSLQGAKTVGQSIHDQQLPRMEIGLHAAAIDHKAS